MDINLQEGEIIPYVLKKNQQLLFNHSSTIPEDIKASHDDTTKTCLKLMRQEEIWDKILYFKSRSSLVHKRHCLATTNIFARWPFFFSKTDKVWQLKAYFSWFYSQMKTTSWKKY